MARFSQAQEMSTRVEDIVLQMNLLGAKNANFIRAKRLIHEILLEHNIVLHHEGQELPPELQNDASTGVTYRSLQHDFLIDLLMIEFPNRYSFTLINLNTDGGIVIKLSDHDIKQFTDNACGHIKEWEEKYDNIHVRIEDFLKGKTEGSGLVRQW